jgi:hypothetical protein
MALALENLASIVADAKFEELVGEVEGQFFDVKSQPYKFSEGLDAKREFAKDVAAFGNAQGGYILVGFTTKTSTTSYGEEIADVHPVPADLFNIDQHIKLLQEWLYPQPVGVQINFVPFGPDSTKGILVVFIPPQNERSKPFLLTKTLTDKKSTDVIIAYVERRLDFTDARSVVELHHALRIGLNLERELLGRMDNLEALMTQHFTGTQQAEDTAQASSRLQERIVRLLNEGGR